MTFTVRKATPEGHPILIGITAPSGAGKTLSMIRLGRGIQEVVGGDFTVIDTENRRAKRYADPVKYPGAPFNHIEFEPPFTSDRYAEAVEAAASAGARTIGIDSMSHEHDGQGGYLEFAQSETERLAKLYKKSEDTMKMSGFIKPAAARRRLINAIIQTRCNFIFNFRAKEKIKPVTGGQPIQLGWQAIAGEEFVFEMICRILLLPGSKGVPDWSSDAFKYGAAKLDEVDRPYFPEGAQLSEQIGRRLAQEYTGIGKPPPATETKIDVDDLKARAWKAAYQGSAEIAAFWKSLKPIEQRALEEIKDDLKSKGAEVDETKSAADGEL